MNTRRARITEKFKRQAVRNERTAIVSNFLNDNQNRIIDLALVHICKASRRERAVFIFRILRGAATVRFIRGELVKKYEGEPERSDEDQGRPH